MDTRTDESLKQQLTAEIELVRERLDGIRKRLADDSTELRGHFEDQVRQIADRADELATTTRDWVAVRIGTASAVEDLGDAVDAIEADLDAAEEGEADTYRAALDRRLRVWRARADRLRVQEALAEMEVRDDLGAVSDRLRAARARALVELRHTGADAKEAVVDLRDDLEELMSDVRHVVERALDALVGDDD